MLRKWKNEEKIMQHLCIRHCAEEVLLKLLIQVLVFHQFLLT